MASLLVQVRSSSERRRWLNPVPTGTRSRSCARPDCRVRSCGVPAAIVLALHGRDGPCPVRRNHAIAGPDRSAGAAIRQEGPRGSRPFLEHRRRPDVQASHLGARVARMVA